MSVAQYVNRQIDLLAYQGAKERGEVQLAMALAQSSNSGQICVGVQKLAQRFLIDLLTEKGSIPYLPDRGCLFMTEARQGYWSNPLDVHTAFAESLTDITNTLQLEESDADPADERFDRAELISVTIGGGDASVTIKVFSLAGLSRDVILPLNIVV